MGASNTNLSKNFSSNEYLVKLVGTEHISSNDPFWNQFLSFSSTIPKNIFENNEVEKDLCTLLEKFVVNNLRSSNFGSLIRVFLLRSTELHASSQCQNDMFTWQTYNALFVLFVICKYLVENVPEETILQQFSDPNVQVDNAAFLDLLIDEFYRILIELPIETVTRSIHHEILNILISLLSIQLYQAAPYDYFNDIYRIFMQGKCSSRSSELLQYLFNNYINHPYNSQGHHGYIYNITSAIGSGLWSVMTLGMGSRKTEEKIELTLDSLGNQSLLLMLILCNYFHSQDSLDNLYHKSFLTLTDESLLSHHTAISIDNSTAASNQAFVPDTSSTIDLPPTNSDPPQNISTTPHTTLDTSPAVINSNESTQPVPLSKVKISYSGLFNRLCHDVKHTHCTLFLYMLLHHNESMKAFILSRTDIDHLVLPLLEVLYTAHINKSTVPNVPPPMKSTRDLYMSLIILLILTEDSSFSSSIHDITLKEVSWLSEHRQLGEMSLGSLVLLVLVRTIQFNMSRMRDQYLQTNCLGALANMSAYFKNIHTYVAQKLITLFSLMLKKYNKFMNKNNKKDSLVVDLNGTESDGSVLEDEPEQELAAIEELMRMMLEVLNSCLSHSLNSNPHLIYTMLYQKELFFQLSNHPDFQDVIFNIGLILDYFSNGLDKQSKNPSVSQVHDFIRKQGLLFKKNRLKKFPDLNFHYVEEEKPEEFFIPYAWCLILQHSCLKFETSRLRLSI